MASSDLPTQHRALVLDSLEDGFKVKTVPTPSADPGSAVVRIEAAAVISYHRDIYNGDRQYAFPKPLVGGASAIGRIGAIGPDATSLEPGQLVYVDCVIHSRDNPADSFLTAIHEGMTDGSRKLMREVWRDGNFAEYAKVPLENCIPLDEARLCGEMGYSVKELLYTCHLLVGFGGLRDIRVEPGEKVLVAPATGGYGGAGVQVAISMGADVIAMGRNEKELSRIKQHVLQGTPRANIRTVKMTQNEEEDAAALKALGPIDAVLDFTPFWASESPHIRSAMQALRHGGRVSSMGFLQAPLLPWIFVARNIMIKGKLMYSRDDIVQFVKMLNAGLFPRGKDFVDVRSFTLEEWKEGLDMGAEHTGIGKLVVLTP